MLESVNNLEESVSVCVEVLGKLHGDLSYLEQRQIIQQSVFRCVKRFNMSEAQKTVAPDELTER
jgi:hypothetical protein